MLQKITQERDIADANLVIVSDILRIIDNKFPLVGGRPRTAEISEMREILSDMWFKLNSEYYIINREVEKFREKEHENK